MHQKTLESSARCLKKIQGEGKRPAFEPTEITQEAASDKLLLCKIRLLWG